MRRLARSVVLAAVALMLAAVSPRADDGRRAWLGVFINDLTKDTLFSLGAADGGVYVMEVTRPSPASLSGLQPGDVIVGVDGRATGNVTELVCLIQARTPGAVVLVNIVRSGKLIAVTAQLARWPETIEPPPFVRDCKDDRVARAG